MTTFTLRRILRFVRRLFARSDDIVEEEPNQSGPTPISSIKIKDKVHLVGVIDSTVSTPGAWEAELHDATGHVTLVWMGRESIPGIDVGTVMHVWGRVAAKESHLVIYNPVYAIQAGA